MGRNTFIKTHFLPSQEEAQEHATKERWYNKDEVIYNAVSTIVRTSALADPLPLEHEMCASGCVVHSSSHRYKLPLIGRWAPWSLTRVFDMNKLCKWPLSGSGKINLITLLGLIWEKEANSIILVLAFFWILTRPSDKWYISHSAGCRNIFKCNIWSSNYYVTLHDKFTTRVKFHNTTQFWKIDLLWRKQLGTGTGLSCEQPIHT